MRVAEIADVTLTELKQFIDERGSILHMLRCDDPNFVGFGECYFSEVLPGAIKAWKRHRIQTQLLAVPVGRVRYVVFDGREGSPTCGGLQVLELGRPDAYLRLSIPPGLWYGFQCIGDLSALIVNCTDRPHDPSEVDQLPASSSTVPYRWPSPSITDNVK